MYSDVKREHLYRTFLYSCTIVCDKLIVKRLAKIISQCLCFPFYSFCPPPLRTIATTLGNFFILCTFFSVILHILQICILSAKCNSRMWLERDGLNDHFPGELKLKEICILYISSITKMSFFNFKSLAVKGRGRINIFIQLPCVIMWDKPFFVGI